MIEFDVALSKDGCPVVIHDPTVRRTTNGHGSVKRLTLEDLRKLDAGSWFSREFAGEKVPTLEEVMDLAAERVCLNIEIKKEAVSRTGTDGIEAKIVSLLRQRGLVEHTVISSFSPKAVRRVKALDPTQSAALLLGRAPVRVPLKQVHAVDADAVHLSYRRLKKKWIEQLVQAGIPVRAYTVNEVSDMRRMIEWGVDGLFTDRIDRLRAVIDELEPVS